MIRNKVFELKMKQNENLWTKRARYLAGEMSANEEIDFRNELNNNPQQQTDLKNMENTFKHFEDHPAKDKKDTTLAWEKLITRLGKDGLLEEESEIKRNRNLLPGLRIAASILLVLALGLPALYFGIFRNENTDKVRTNISENGVSTVDLPDGSRVYLNEGAEISYPSGFKQDRSVKLDGEAFFEVMSDPDNPFTVQSGKVIISVLGTSFNVKRSGNSSDAEVYVESGKVMLALVNSETSIRLVPGELGISGDGVLNRSEQSDPNYISWKTKDFKFVDTELVEVLLELEDSYHVNIHTGALELEDMRITTSYSEQSIDAILETIGAAFGLTVMLKEDGYYLTN